MFHNWNKFTATILIHSASIDSNIIKPTTTTTTHSDSGIENAVMLRTVFSQDGKERSTSTVFKELERSDSNLDGERKETHNLVANFEQEIKIRVKFRIGPNGTTLIARDFSLYLEAFLGRGKGSTQVPSDSNTRVEYLYEELCRSNIPLATYFLDKCNEGPWDSKSIITLPLRAKVVAAGSTSLDNNLLPTGIVLFQIRFQELFEEKLGDKLVGMVVAHKTAKQIKEEVSHNKLRVEQQLEQQSTPSAPTPVKSESTTTTPIDEQKTLDRRSVTSRSLASLITHGLTPVSTSTSPSPQEKVIMLEQRCEVLEKELLNARKEHISDAVTAKAKEAQYATELEELRHRCTELDQTIETLYAKIAQFHWERDEDHSNCMKCQAEFTLFNRR